MADAARPARPRVIVTRALPQSVERRMAELFDVVLNRDDASMAGAALAATLADADVLVPTVTDTIDAAVARAAAGNRATGLAPSRRP